MVLARLEQRMAGLCVTSLSDAELGGLVGEINAAQRCVEGYLTVAATEASRREASGSGPVAEEVMLYGGEVSARRARQLTTRSQLSGQLPELTAALTAGRARPENVDLIAVAVPALSAGETERLVSCDGELAERASALPPDVFAKYWRHKRTVIADPPPEDEGLSVAEAQRAASWFDLRRRRDGMWRLDGELDDERGRLLDDLVTRTARIHTTGDGGPTGNDRATALVELITHRPERNGAGSARLGIGYIIDANTLGQGPHDATVAQTWGGEDYDPARIARLACDADLYAITIDRAGHPTGAGRTRRHATREQRLQLRALYDRCPLDETTGFDRCEIHHVNVFYEHGGATTLDNLVPISTAWHHRIHDRGWTLTMDPDRTLHLNRPNGTHDRTIPPPRPLTRPPRASPP